jgi:GT2 family glycosyltransferase
MPSLPNFALLVVCHNRRELTLRCLDAFYQALGKRRASIFLFDDASTDGTAEAVASQFQDVEIIRGDGSFFWNGGLHRAWRAALAEPVEGFLWLNDDVTLDLNAIDDLEVLYGRAKTERGSEDFILAGTMRDPEGTVSYGGHRIVPSPFAIRFRPVMPQTIAQAIDTFDGNFVYVPRKVTERIGINDNAYFHNLGDRDYGLRAKASGIDVLLMPGTQGVCSKNAEKGDRGYGSPDLTLFEQWRKVNTHHGLRPSSWARFTRRHSGHWFPLHFLLPYRRLVLPRWLLRLIER